MNAPADPVEELLRNRRSIRRYKPQTPPPGWIEAALACAATAPSPSNLQPVRFVRIDSGPLREKLRASLAGRRARWLETIERTGGPKKTRNLVNVYFRYSEFMFDAPVLMAVGVDPAAQTFALRLRSAGLIDEDLKGDTDLDISVGLALANFILKCQSLGLGTCILSAPLTFLPEPERLLGLEDVRVKCFLTVGFPDETPGPIERKTVAQLYRVVRG